MSAAVYGSRTVGRPCRCITHGPREQEGSDLGLQKLQRLQNDCRTDCKTQLTKSLHLPFSLMKAQGAWHGAQHDRKRSSQQLAPFMQTDMGRVTPIIFFAFALKASVVFLAGITQCKAQGLRHRRREQPVAERVHGFDRCWCLSAPQYMRDRESANNLLLSPSTVCPGLAGAPVDHCVH